MAEHTHKYVLKDSLFVLTQWPTAQDYQRFDYYFCEICLDEKMTKKESFGDRDHNYPEWFDMSKAQRKPRY